jgi:hypothetical protein
VIDPGASEQPVLVETPENAPKKRTPRPRRPRAQAPSPVVEAATDPAAPAAPARDDTQTTSE